MLGTFILCAVALVLLLAAVGAVVFVVAINWHG